MPFWYTHEDVSEVVFQEYTYGLVLLCGSDSTFTPPNFFLMIWTKG